MCALYITLLPIKNAVGKVCFTKMFSFLFHTKNIEKLFLFKVVNGIIVFPFSLFSIEKALVVHLSQSKSLT